MNWFYTEDYGLTAAQLKEKYSPDGAGEHPGYLRWNWRRVVAVDGTQLGYWNWLQDQLATEQDELDRDNPYTQWTREE